MKAYVKSEFMKQLRIAASEVNRGRKPDVILDEEPVIQELESRGLVPERYDHGFIKFLQECPTANVVRFIADALLRGDVVTTSWSITLACQLQEYTEAAWEEYEFHLKRACVAG